MKQSGSRVVEFNCLPFGDDCDPEFQLAAAAA